MIDGPVEIDAVELVSARMSIDGERLRVRLRDQTGRVVAMSLPANWLNAMVSAMPRQLPSGIVHTLASWSMDRSSKRDTVILTLRTPEGQSVSFAAKSWQFEGMATIATYGRSPASLDETLH